MNKKIFSLLTLLMVAALLLGACGDGEETEAPEAAATEAPEVVVTEAPPAETEAPEVVVTEAPMIGEGFTACEVTDTGGIDDASFNETAWNGIVNAEADFGISSAFVESQQQTDYDVNIAGFLDTCDLIIAVGFLMDAATQASANANPDQMYAIVDVDFFDFVAFEDITLDNVKELTYRTDQAAFLAGYVAASVTETGIVGTFGGMSFGSVTIFMDGFYYGVEYYNAQNSADVQVIGWDPAAQEGLFTGNFESTDDGRAMGVTLMDEGADVILPVAGPVGLGTAAAVQEAGNAWIIGVDADFTLTAPDFADVTLTSVMKNMDASIYDVISDLLNDLFVGGLYIGTLENGGVGLAGLNDVVSADVQAELVDIIAGIIAGDIQTRP
ncbi:MAG: BMP family ABC transporter substrate-binding protein [Chloroflexi bacterium]|nr:BMP family ABC transporter substrate-binding protein [Chloroflexota bacterium]